jgi:alpha-tubulin suppressor-like RCC1 family protein
MKSITPVVSVILMVLITIVASVSAFFFINSNVSDLQSQGNLDTYPGSDNSRLNLVSITGSKAIVRNDGSSPVTQAIVFVNGELLNFELDPPILPGQLREINYTARKAGEDLEIKIIYNSGKTVTDFSLASVNTNASGFTDINVPLNPPIVVYCSGDTVNFENNIDFTNSNSLVIGCSNYSLAPNLVLNGDFETGDLTNWELGHEGGGNLILINSDYKFDSYSLQISHTNATFSGNPPLAGYNGSSLHNNDYLKFSINGSINNTVDNGFALVRYIFGEIGEDLVAIHYVMYNSTLNGIVCDAPNDNYEYIKCIQGLNEFEFNEVVVHPITDYIAMGGTINLANYENIQSLQFGVGAGSTAYFDNIIINESFEGKYCDSDYDNLADGVCSNGICDTNDPNDNYFNFCNGYNNTWLYGNLIGNNSACCGDDGTLDDFYNSTSYCCNGSLNSGTCFCGDNICQTWENESNCFTDCDNNLYCSGEKVNFENNINFIDSESLVCGCKNYSYAPNFVLNGDFETGDFSHWEVVNENFIHTDVLINNIFKIDSFSLQISDRGDTFSGGAEMPHVNSENLPNNDYLSFSINGNINDTIENSFALVIVKFEDYEINYVMYNGTLNGFNCDIAMGEETYIYCIQNLNEFEFNNIILHPVTDFEENMVANVSSYENISLTIAVGAGSTAYFDNIIINESFEGKYCDSDYDNLADGVCSNGICDTNDPNDNYFNFCNGYNNTWLYGNLIGNNSACCGDDGTLDDFYNSTSYCCNGSFDIGSCYNDDSICQGWENTYNNNDDCTPLLVNSVNIVSFNDGLKGYCNANSSDNDILRYNFSWNKNGVEIFSNIKFMEGSISAGISYSCGVLTNGSAMCWGSNNLGELGKGSLGNSNIPVYVFGNYNFSIISAGSSLSCGVLINGSAMCWGRNLKGGLGNGSTGGESYIPVYVFGDYNFSSISAGAYFSCGVLTNGTALCWGYNNHGQLGDGSTTDSNVPVFVSGNHNFKIIDTGLDHTCGVLINGSAMCWGYNNYGQLGDGLTTEKHIPTRVSGNKKFTMISAGMSYSCGVLDNGYNSGVCWGKGDKGQLGNNGNSDSHVPVYIGNWDFSSISAGWESTSCGVLIWGGEQWYTNGKCWGYGLNGRKGDDLTTNSNIPVDIDGDYGFSFISMGSAHACGILANGDAKCWGFNSQGELGDNSLIEKHIPTNVFGNNNFINNNFYWNKNTLISVLSQNYYSLNDEINFFCTAINANSYSNTKNDSFTIP